MGSGKTTVGQYLASRLSIPFYDTDYLIEKKTGERISSLFEKQGEAYFRQLEADLIDQWMIDEGVVATGGGLPCYTGLMERLNSLGLTVYLECPPEVLANRVQGSSHRPLLGNDEEETSAILGSILSQRVGMYQKAQLRVNATEDARTVSERILYLFHQKQKST